MADFYGTTEVAITHDVVQRIQRLSELAGLGPLHPELFFMKSVLNVPPCIVCQVWYKEKRLGVRVEWSSFDKTPDFERLINVLMKSLIVQIAEEIKRERYAMEERRIKMVDQMKKDGVL
jgi:hypothetical protein